MPRSSNAHDVPFGATLRRLRLDAGMTQEKMAFEANVQRNFVSLIELGQTQPTLTTICTLAEALGMTASGLVAQAEIDRDRSRKQKRRMT